MFVVLLSTVVVCVVGTGEDSGNSPPHPPVTRSPVIIRQTLPPGTRLTLAPNARSPVGVTRPPARCIGNLCYLNGTVGNATRVTVMPTVTSISSGSGFTTCNSSVGSSYVRVQGQCVECNALAMIQTDNTQYNVSTRRMCPSACLSATLFATLSECRGFTSQSQSLSESRVQTHSTSTNVSTEFNVPPDEDAVGIYFYRQNTSAAEAHLNESDDSNGRHQVFELTRVIGSSFATQPIRRRRQVSSLSGARLAVAYTLSTRDYSLNKTIDTVEGAAGSSGSHIYLSFASNNRSTPIAPYPSSYQFLGPQIRSAGIIFDNGTTLPNVASALEFSLSIDAPDGFWLRPDTGELMISARNVIGNVSFAIKAAFPGVPAVVLRNFTFIIDHRDVDVATNGPNSLSCANDATRIDYTEFNDQFECECSSAGDFVGDNCDELMRLHATGIALTDGHWHHNRTAWAAEKAYIVDAPTIETVTILPVNITVVNRTREIWWEIRCNFSNNLTSGSRERIGGTPDGVFIDTTTGRLSVSFSASQVNTSYTECNLRVFYTQRNYVPVVVVSNMTFEVKDPDFGKPRLQFATVAYATFRGQNSVQNDNVALHNRSHWTIGKTYHIPPVSLLIQGVSDDSAVFNLTSSQEKDIQFVLKGVSGATNGFFIDSNSGEISGTPNVVDTETNSTAELRATHPDFLDGIVSTLTIQSVFADTDSRSNATGPHGKDCNESRQRVDGVEYDGSFTCNCSGFIYQGDNCDEPRLQAVGHNSNGNGDSMSMIVVGVAVAVVVLVAAFAAVQLYQKRKAYWELMKPVDFEMHLQRLASAGIVAKVNKDEPPTELDRRNIVLEVELGSGNFGEVWKGTWIEEVKRHTGRKSSGTMRALTSKRMGVAIKTLKNESPSGNDEFLREASVTWQFNHENVVRMYGVVTCGAPYLLVLELCSHGELKGYLQKGDVDDPEHYSLGRLFHFLVGIAEGMKHLIQCGFVHRDLATRNVLVGDNYDSKICDFGLGRETAEDSDYYTSNDANMLVPIRWTDPNVLGTGKFSEYTDVWAYGVTAIEIFTRGATPYRGWLNTYIIEQTKAGYRMPCPEGCPPEVYKSVIYPCWLSSDENASPRRPNFSILCAELARVGAKIDPRLRTQSSVSAKPNQDVKKQKKNRAYAPANEPTDTMSSNDYYEYAEHAVSKGEENEYLTPVSGKAQSQYEYMEADINSKNLSSSATEKSTEGQNVIYTPRTQVNTSTVLYSPMERRGTVDNITMNRTHEGFSVSSKSVDEDVTSRENTLEKETAFGFEVKSPTDDGYLETVGE